MEHYTRNTESAWEWCNKCQRLTEHRVDGVKRGPCLEHETTVTKKPEPIPDKQEKLF
jgi:ribosomal protein L44E